MYVLGQFYRLTKATTVVERSRAAQVCQALPRDSLVVIEGMRDDGATVDIRCDNRELWMFRVSR